MDTRGQKNRGAKRSVPGKRSPTQSALLCQEHRAMARDEERVMPPAVMSATDSACLHAKAARAYPQSAPIDKRDFQQAIV